MVTASNEREKSDAQTTEISETTGSKRRQRAAAIIRARQNDPRSAIAELQGVYRPFLIDFYRHYGASDTNAGYLVYHTFDYLLTRKADFSRVAFRDPDKWVAQLVDRMVRRNVDLLSKLDIRKDFRKIEQPGEVSGPNFATFLNKFDLATTDSAGKNEESIDRRSDNFSLDPRWKLLDEYAAQNPGKPVSVYAMELFGDLEKYAPVAPPVPKRAPVLWLEGRHNDEAPHEFITRVYEPWLGKGLTSGNIKKLDLPLYNALAAWTRREGNQLPADFILPTRRDITTSWVDKIQHDPEIVREARRLSQLATRKGISLKPR
jgi:hypothetical protein